ncbi:DUF202 domain-containing protein [Lacihabitans sp. LS3-19]|uniref:DUF202 domain-containing protein n=1 Tax=Lacihabitans sp. LS3-19 TaxID=2487335 RepID=UPI0020CE282F|nr:DUF202 domain-containing protein [Lacihabitans sp. LS3-19]
MNRDLILRENLALQRTTLANQTTLLAFLRTSLYFSLAGLSLENLLKIEQHRIVEIIMFSISLFILIYGIANYIVHKNKIKKSYGHVGNYKDEYESKS